MDSHRATVPPKTRCLPFLQFHIYVFQDFLSESLDISAGFIALKHVWYLYTGLLFIRSQSSDSTQDQPGKLESY